MHKDDEKFVMQLIDSDSRKEIVARWRRSRIGHLVSFLAIFIGVVMAAIGDQPIPCGLFSGVAALQFTLAGLMDLRIKTALLVDAMDTRRFE